MKKKSRFSITAKIVALSVITLVILFPIILTVLTSLKPAQEIVTATPRLLPDHYTLSNYIRLFSTGNYGRYLLNSCIISLLTALLCVIISSLAAYAIVWMKTPGKRVFTWSLFITYMFPAVISVIPLFLICYEMDLIDNKLVLVIIYLAFDLPFGIWLMMSCLESIPSGLIEASKLDGCSDMQCLRKIVMPLSLPFIMTNAALSFVLSWNDYLVASVLITNDSNRTLAVGMQSLIGSHHVDFGLITAGGVIMLVPVLLMFLLAQKYILKGFSL
jgi:multiple sugar transport system permease protein